MTNKEIANHFRELSQLMELHNDNPFKIRSYSNAYITLRKLDGTVADMDIATLSGIKGIGKAIAEKIREVADTGQIRVLEEFRAKTPPGVRDMLQIAGFGPKKVLTVWQELGVESIGELMYAVNENRLIEVKGFGLKTQEDLRQKLAYFQLSQGQYLYARLEAAAQVLCDKLSAALPQAQIALTGAIRRAAVTLERIELLVAGAGEAAIKTASGLDWQATPQGLASQTAEGFPVQIYLCESAEWGSKMFRYTAADEFMQAFLQAYPTTDFKQLKEEEEVFQKVSLPWLPPVLRETDWGLGLAQNNTVPTLIQEEDIQGVIHTHTTYSDGIHTLEEMAHYARAQGYNYIGITDHSKAAFYANGLREDRVLAQIAEIDRLNEQFTDFRILKGIESDILHDGSLDYPDEILARFDFIIASVHSNLRMEEEKANKRLLAAIENPYTSILGHPTGRLLLSRPGYPIDHRLIIDACAANGVAIELNANPYRLDLDWSWIPYALEKGVWISINPDAHSREGIHDIHYGVLAASKGGLTRSQCLNALPVSDFLKQIKK
ncbi:MAG: helix-hairpin-helix domain-containing protein [Saprospiraceae bacterium]